MKKIEILFGPDGEIEIEAFGYNGKGCKDATKFLEQALGSEKDVKQKAEWFLRNAQSIQEAKSYGYNPAKICG